LGQNHSEGRVYQQYFLDRRYLERTQPTFSPFNASPLGLNKNLY
jgi:hypothetical protein